jgi:hypothetical protein
MIRHIVTPVLVASIALVAAGCAGASTAAPTASSVSTTSASPSSLDGVSYDVTLSFPGEAPMQDKLRFAGGRFESTACSSLGFPQWTDYQATRDGGALGFAVTTRHPAGTTMEWKGHVVGSAIEGTAVRTMNGQRSVATFRGPTS